MESVGVLNLVVWSVQGFLALFFLGAGAPKSIGRGLEQWTGFSDQPRPLVIFIGFTEVLGAAGLVLPMATGILPWLTPLAAVGLAVIVLMAAGFHIRADERLNALETALWASIAVPPSSSWRSCHEVSHASSTVSRTKPPFAGGDIPHIRHLGAGRVG